MLVAAVALKKKGGIIIAGVKAMRPAATAPRTVTIDKPPASPAATRPQPTFPPEPASPLRSFYFSSTRRHTRYWRDWSSDVCSSDLALRFVHRWAGYATGIFWLVSNIAS